MIAVAMNAIRQTTPAAPAKSWHDAGHWRRLTAWGPSP